MTAHSQNVQIGEFLTLFNYYKVEHMDSEYIHVVDEQGNRVRISKPIVNDSMHSTTQYTKSVKVTRTRLAQIMEGVGHAAFCVTFKKQVTPTSVADELENKDLGTKAKRRKVLNELMAGETRVMHAKLQRSIEDDVEMELGRYKVIDLEHSEPGKPAMRLVDTRTVSELIVEGVRYHT
jgi:hypothetical protein